MQGGKNMLSIKHRAFKFLSSGLLNYFQKFGKGKYLSYFLEESNPIYTVIKGKDFYKYYTPNSITHWRADTLFTKEPETIDWINTFEDDDVFYDIGANVGMYSIYAGVNKKNLKIFSFEPTFFNFWLLNKNIYINNLQEKVTALCVALYNKDTLDYIFMPEISDGSALVNIGSALDYNKNQFNSVFKQGSIAFALDSFIEKYKIPLPNHIKIDVDGVEKEIVEGAKNTLSNKNLKSLLIELNDNVPEDMELKEKIMEFGLELRDKKHSEMFDNTKYKDIYNYIFSR